MKGYIPPEEVAIRKAREAACPKCGEPGAHFIPPSFGMPGFYVCDRLEPREPCFTWNTDELTMPYCFICDDWHMPNQPHKVAESEKAGHNPA